MLVSQCFGFVETNQWLNNTFSRITLKKLLHCIIFVASTSRDTRSPNVCFEKSSVSRVVASTYQPRPRTKWSRTYDHSNNRGSCFCSGLPSQLQRFREGTSCETSRAEHQTVNYCRCETWRLVKLVFEYRNATGIHVQDRWCW